MKDSKTNTITRSKRKRYIFTLICGALGIIGSIGIGYIKTWVYFVIPFFIVLELLLIRIDLNIPRCKIWLFIFYIASALLGSIFFNIFEMTAVNPRAWFAILYLVPLLWFLYDLFTPSSENDDMKTV